MSDGTPDGPCIFLSYAREDVVSMQRVKTTFETNGVRVWTDEQLVPGTASWRQEIEKAIDTAAAVVVLLSPAAKGSRWVRTELSYAELKRKPTYPVLVEGESATAVPFELSRAQWIDIRSEPDELDRLVRSLVRSLVRPTSTPGSGPLRDRRSLQKLPTHPPRPLATRPAGSLDRGLPDLTIASLLRQPSSGSSLPGRGTADPRRPPTLGADPSEGTSTGPRPVHVPARRAASTARSAPPPRSDALRRARDVLWMHRRGLTLATTVVALVTLASTSDLHLPDLTFPGQEPDPPAQVVVRVANAAGSNGAGGRLTTEIADAGYPTVEVTNTQPIRDTTAVLYGSGYKDEASALAETLGSPTPDIAALSDPPQVDPGGANLVVLLGRDLATN